VCVCVHVERWGFEFGDISKPVPTGHSRNRAVWFGITWNQWLVTQGEIWPALTVALARPVAFGESVLAKSSKSRRHNTYQLDHDKLTYIKSNIGGRVGTQKGDEDLNWCDPREWTALRSTVRTTAQNKGSWTNLFCWVVLFVHVIQPFDHQLNFNASLIYNTPTFSVSVVQCY
jgi:hypothetical protein